MATIPVQERPGPATAAPAGSAAARRWLAVVIPTALGLLLSVYRITGRSLGFDEGATVSIASQHGAALRTAIAHDGGNMSGYYLLTHVLIGAFGDGLLVIRLVSALSIAAVAGLIAVIALRLYDPLVALVAGVLTAVSLPLVYWGQTARGYGPMVALVCAGMLAFIVLADPPDGRGPRRGAWIAYVVAMTVAMYCSFVAVLVVPAQLVVLVRRRAAWRRVGSALAVTGLLCAPLAVLAVRRGSGQLFWVTPPNRMVDTQVLQSLTSAGLSPNFHNTLTTDPLMWATAAALLALLGDLARRRRRGDAWHRSLILAWCILPALLTFVYSLLFQPVFVPRNLLMSTPAVSLALASALAAPRRARVVAGMLVVVLGLRAWQVGAAYGVSPEPWSAVTARVLDQSRPGDCVAFYPNDVRMAFQYYLRNRPAAGRRAPRSILPTLPWGKVRPFVEDYRTLTLTQIARRAAGCRRMWFISSHEGQPDGPAQSLAHRATYFRLDAELQTLFGLALVQSYGYASTIHVQLLPGRPRRYGGSYGRSIRAKKVIRLNPTSSTPLVQAITRNHLPLP